MTRKDKRPRQRTSFSCESLVNPTGYSWKSLPQLSLQESQLELLLEGSRAHSQVTAHPLGGLAREPWFGARFSRLSSPHCPAELMVTSSRERLHRMGNNQICSWKKLQRSFSHLLDTFDDSELTSRLFDCWTASFVRKLFCLQQNLCSCNLGLSLLIPSSQTVH